MNIKLGNTNRNPYVALFMEKGGRGGIQLFYVLRIDQPLLSLGYPCGNFSDTSS